MAHLQADNLDDLMRDSIAWIRTHGTALTASRGRNTEVTGAMLELTNPLARLSRSEKKGTPFSALGELCWYLSGREDHNSISWYLPNAYRTQDVTQDGILPGAYGPRLVDKDAPHCRGQLHRVISLLRNKPTTRQAVIQLYDARDLETGQADVPCTCTIQFFCRGNKLHAATYMRSNDMYRGFPHDVFCFTMIQELVARTLGLNLGVYKHIVGSLHLYDTDTKNLNRYLEEGYQSKLSPMPAMPNDSPLESLRTFLHAETMVRAEPLDQIIDLCEANMDPYWADLLRLLMAFRHRKDRNSCEISSIQRKMNSTIYDPFLAKLAAKSQR